MYELINVLLISNMRIFIEKFNKKLIRINKKFNKKYNREIYSKLLNTVSDRFYKVQITMLIS